MFRVQEGLGLGFNYEGLGLRFRVWEASCRL